MSEFILTETDVSDNKKFSGDEKADDQDFIEKRRFYYNSDKEEDVILYRRVNKKIRKIKNEKDTAVNFVIYSYPEGVKDGKDPYDKK